MRVLAQARPAEPALKFQARVVARSVVAQVQPARQFLVKAPMVPAARSAQARALESSGPGLAVVACSRAAAYSDYSSAA